MATKIVVLDDDPTGNQTVHSCPLLTRWSSDILATGLDARSPLLFILTNTRSLDSERAAAVTREICVNLKKVLTKRAESLLFVSRSDSTLRGHYPVETDVMAEMLGPFDAHFLVPAFFEGGRVTIDGVHYIREHERLVRTDQTEFARDSVFGYTTSYLPDYVEEKTHGRIKSADVVRIPILPTVDAYLERIIPLEGNRCAAVDTQGYADLRLFAAAVMKAVDGGKRFLFRSGASILSALAALPPQPIVPEEMFRLRRSDAPGVVIVGSHVQKTTEQLEMLLREPGVAGVEVPVSRLPQEAGEIVREVGEEIEKAQSRDKCAAVYTSRSERVFPTAAERLQFGEAVSDVLVKVVQRLPISTSFLISKGGITSNDVLSKGLELAVCNVVGQIIPGCTLVTTPAVHRLGALPVVIFPGNVGGPEGLRRAYELLNTGRSS